MFEETTPTMESSSPASSAPEFDLFVANEISMEQALALRARVHSSQQEKGRFARMVEELPDPGSTQSPEKILRRGVGHWALGQYDHAVDCLRRLKGHVVGAYFHGRSLLSKGAAKEAKAVFEEALKASKDAPEFQSGILFALEAMEDWDNLRKEWKGAGKAYLGTADASYFEGRLAEVERRYEDAIASYEKAIEKDPNHRQASFRLAYQLDLRGLDDEALALYEKLAKSPPADVNVVMNLGVMYEDRGEYRKAAACFDAVSRVNPTHPRAKLYLKDARSSLNMFYDEDLEKKEDKLQQILRIPITDFELSVRARNCLAKMEIQTLGDLVKKSEPELLSFKNFGETSLNEIKEILRSKGLRLGMAREDGGVSMIDPGIAPAAAPAEVPAETMAKSISELDLSVRSRRTVDALGILTLGELASRSERELLTTPNFGQTSLNEIKEKLRLFGLGLADSTD